MKRLIKNESGALLYVFAILFPVILVFFSLALDGSNSLRSRARLNDAVKQGLYAVTVEDLGKNNKNQQIIANYIHSYLPKIKTNLADITVDVKLMDGERNDRIYVAPDLVTTEGYLIKRKYTANAKITIPKLVPLEILGENSKITINSDNNAALNYAQPKIISSRSEDLTNWEGIIGEYHHHLGYLYQKDQSHFPTTAAHDFEAYIYMDDNANQFKLDWPILPGTKLQSNYVAQGYAPLQNGGITVYISALWQWYGQLAPESGVTVPYLGFFAPLMHFQGPHPTPAQQNAKNPGEIAKVTLPATFAMEGRYKKDAVISYDFTIKKWFISRNKLSTYQEAKAWCDSTKNYRMVTVNELVNGSSSSYGWKGKYSEQSVKDRFGKITYINYLPIATEGSFISEWTRLSTSDGGGGTNTIEYLSSWISTPSKIKSGYNYVVSYDGVISHEPLNSVKASALCVSK